MIQINDRFECELDRWGWVLREWADSVGKDGEPRKTCYETYHSSLEQVCKHIVDRRAGDSETVEEIVRNVKNARVELVDFLKRLKDEIPDARLTFNKRMHE